MGVAVPKQKELTTSSSFKLRGVGPQIARHLARLNIHTPVDLLFHLPSRYQDRTHIQPIRQTRPGDHSVIEGVVQSVSKPVKGKTKLLCELRDATGRMHLRFFHLLRFQAHAFTSGTRLRCYGEVRLGSTGLEMVHPEFKIVDDAHPLPVDQHLTPIYPATDGLSQYMLRKLTTNALEWMEKHAGGHELLPPQFVASFSFPHFREALHVVHRPPRVLTIPALQEHQTPAQKRLIFEELLAHRVSLLQLKTTFQHQVGASLPMNGTLIDVFKKSLPYQLTSAQQRVVLEIQHDLSRSFPMLRLVQGDVGSGKTVVAALAMLQAVENGYQAALMAPTELLAEQHARNFMQWFEPLGVKVVFLSGSVKASARKAAMQAIENGEAHIVIGTHALFQQEITFAKLALVVVDEQHRFGVQQRALFREKGMQAQMYPHQLVMTATPIPRTLAMTFYADLDCSVIDELPPGRTPVQTTVLASSKRPDVIKRIRDACLQGRQAYWVCPLIEESEVLDCEAATATAETLQQIMPDIRVGLIHGRMKSADKESVMRAFKDGEILLLVATTVIEVGVDVPNASLMVIENAERLGLSQLHQLRGRVGRGAQASYCVLIYHYPISSIGKERLAVMRETTDGFKIAQRDLELRGPGEVLGTRQTGELSFRIADLIRDSELLPAVSQAAEVMLRDHADKLELLFKRWLADKQEYGKV